MKTIAKFLGVFAVVLGTGTAHSHVVLKDKSAATGSTYRATLLVGHGCDGAATTGIRVQLPEGFQGAKPMPKAGWTLTTLKARLPKPYDSHGKTITDDVVEISWTANGPENALQEAWYDEFVLQGTAPRQAGAYWFKVFQTCDKGQKSWVQVPASGTSTKGLKEPAALLEVQDAAPAGHVH